MAKTKIVSPADEGIAAAKAENRQIAIESSYKKAITALLDVVHVDHDYLNETERELVDFVRTMLIRKIY